jgi:hypothetical protein
VDEVIELAEQILDLRRIELLPTHGRRRRPHTRPDRRRRRPVKQTRDPVHNPLRIDRRPLSSQLTPHLIIRLRRPTTTRMPTHDTPPQTPRNFTDAGSSNHRP